ncbi:solute carrier family 22 member 13-like isoform X2 [Trematomus bernacchii]|uniref:solute carrier family 22 member 13-like isoform X2 n=1 Tax=Trematomus bernacchii TaxID=40690 RepID=UPI00146CF783|nr:solute carrier family 22 member 13-like isoform X2 [Trematomus bernacchii]
MSSFGEILREIGEFGGFQKRLLAGICILSIFSAFDMLGQVFVGLNFPHRCNTDWILERGPNLTEERQRNLTLPLNKDGGFESCEMFTPVDLDLETIEAYGINKTTGCTHGWDYDAPVGASSIVTEFDVVCDSSGLIEVSQSIAMAGSLVGALAYGAISDRFGRRFSILLCVSLLLFFGVGSAFSPNIYVYMVFKFLCGTSSVNLQMNTSVMGVEWTGPSNAARSTTIITTFFPVGLTLLSGIAYLIHDWRILQLVLFSPLLVLFAVYYRFLPESARWLISQGRKEEALKELQRAARLNGTTVPEHLLDKLEIEGTSGRRNVFDIFRISYMRKRTLIMGYNCNSFILRTDPECGQLWPQYLPHAVHLWSRSISFTGYFLRSDSTHWKEDRTSGLPVLWGSCLPHGPCRPKRSSCCGDNHSSHRGVCCYRLLQHSLCVHYRIIPNYFKAEWIWCELDVWSRGGDPGSTGETPGRLPSLHPHADIRHHPHHCCWSLLVTA